MKPEFSKGKKESLIIKMKTLVDVPPDCVLLVVFFLMLSIRYLSSRRREPTLMESEKYFSEISFTFNDLASATVGPVSFTSQTR